MSVKMNETHSYSTLASGSDLFFGTASDPLEPVFEPLRDPVDRAARRELQRCNDTVWPRHHPRKPIRDFAHTSSLGLAR
jgi:hypothetical protein